MIHERCSVNPADNTEYSRIISPILQSTIHILVHACALCSKSTVACSLMTPSTQGVKQTGDALMGTRFIQTMMASFYDILK